MDEIKLKPCPFCGGKGVEILEDENKYLYYRYMAQCQKCGANAKLGRTKEEACKAWNQRADYGKIVFQRWKDCCKSAEVEQKRPDKADPSEYDLCAK